MEKENHLVNYHHFPLERTNYNLRHFYQQNINHLFGLLFSPLQHRDASRHAASAKFLVLMINDLGSLNFAKAVRQVNYFIFFQLFVVVMKNKRLGNCPLI